MAAQPERRRPAPDRGVAVDDARSHDRDRSFERVPLIGRDEDRRHLDRLLTTRELRVVTIAGAGGAGKTSIALAAFDRAAPAFTGGGVAVSLAAIRDPEQVPAEIAAALSITDQRDASPASLVLDAIAGRALLIFLDNFEQVLPAASFVAELCAQCPNVTVLVTSRAPLRVRAEHLYELAPLRTTAGDELAPSPAAELFVERAKTVRSGVRFDDGNREAVEQLCSLLDGQPLAIELAAARLVSLSPAALLERLRRPMTSLSALGQSGPDSPDRQRTVRDTIAWSVDLLTSSQRRLLIRLAVFEGGCTLDGAEQVAFPSDPLDDLEALARFHLVSVRGHDEFRYTMYPTVRAFAMEQLSEQPPGEREQLTSLHSEYVLRLAEAASGGLESLDESHWYVRVDADYHNVRVTLEHMQSERMGLLGLRLTANLGRYWFLAGRIHEGRQWLERFRALVSDDELTPDLAANTAVWLGRFAAEEGLVGPRSSEARNTIANIEAGRVAFRSIGDHRGVLRANDALLSALVNTVGADDEIAVRDEAFDICRQIGDRWWLHAFLFRAALIAQARSELMEFSTFTDQLVAMAREVGDDRHLAVGMWLTGLRETYIGTPEDAERWLQDALTCAQSVAYRHQIKNFIVIALGQLALERGDVAGAAQHFRDGLESSLAIRDWQTTGYSLMGLALIAARIGRDVDAATLHGVVDAHRDALNSALPAKTVQGNVATMQAVVDRLGQDAFDSTVRQGERLGWNAAAAVAFGIAQSVRVEGRTPDESLTDGPATPPTQPSRPHQLTPREVDVLTRISAGDSNSELAVVLFISVATVERHIANLYRKIGVRRRSQAVQYAFEHGYNG